jgi:hypothetical protein
MIVNELTVFASLTVRFLRGVCQVLRSAQRLTVSRPGFASARHRNVRWLPAISPRWVRRPWSSFLGWRARREGVPLRRAPARTLALTCSGSSPFGSGSGAYVARCHMRRHICGGSLGRSRSLLRLGCARCLRTPCPTLGLHLLWVGTGHCTVFVLAQLPRPVLLVSLSPRSARLEAGASTL